MTVRVSILHFVVFRNAVQICACAKLHCCSLTWALLTMTSAKPHVTTDMMLHRVADQGLQLHKAMQGSAAPLTPSEDATLIDDLNQSNADGRIMCRAPKLAKMQQHAILTDGAPLHASTDVHECYTVDQRNADQRSQHVHASKHHTRLHR